MYTEHTFLDRFAAARDDGFTSVEMTFPYEHSPDVVARAAKAAGVRVVEFNLPPGPLKKGVSRGFAAVPGMEEQYLAQVKEGIDYAKAVGCGHLLTLAGVCQPRENFDLAWRTLVSNLREAASACAKAGIVLLVEPHNRREHPNYVLFEVEQACLLISQVSSRNLRLLFDLYHVQIQQGDVTARLDACYQYIAHIQVANPPLRTEPGTGELNYEYFFSMLEKRGYAGWIGGEYTPSSGDTSGSLLWMRKNGWLPTRKRS
jgi:hydroxypyruvate isomerase